MWLLGDIDSVTGEIHPSPIVTAIATKPAKRCSSSKMA